MTNTPITIDPTAPVLVTGASGYIAGWIVKGLLERGQAVHATVRDPGKMSSVAHLKAMPGADTRLTLFKADLLDEGSFDAAMQGCELVIHTASPFIISGFKDANEALVRPAVEGTRNVLAAASRTPSVKRVVLTSSVASVFGDNQDAAQAPGGVLTEAQWNTTSSVDHQPYSFSKVEAEKAAWEMQKAQPPGSGHHWDLVTINPSMVYGPSLTKMTSSTSVGTMIQMGNGKLKTGVPDLTLGVVDVRDVAAAHIRAGFTPEAEGRHILNATELSMMQIAGVLKKKFGPTYPWPSMITPKPLAWAFGPLFGITRKFVATNVGHPMKLDNTRSRAKLGIDYRPVSETIGDHFQQLLDDGLVKKRG